MNNKFVLVIFDDEAKAYQGWRDFLHAEVSDEFIDQVEREAKLKALHEQADRAEPEVGDRVQKRIAELRKDFEQREQKLTRAFETTQEALH